MADIQISITDKRPQIIGAPVIVCGNSDYTITFSFDAEWGAGTKTARFVYIRDGAVMYEDVVFTGSTVAVPILINIREVRVGVYAGNLQTSTPVVIPCECSIRCGTSAPADPTPSQYDQIIQLLQRNNTAIAGIHVGGSQILRNSQTTPLGSLSTPALWSEGAWRKASGSNGTWDSLTIDDCPEPYIQHGWRITSLGDDPSVQQQIAIAQNNIPLRAGEEYTLSCYARGHGTLNISAPNGIRVQLNTDTWQRCAYTFTAASDLLSGVFFSARYQGDVVEVCGMKLELGNQATAWNVCPLDVMTLEERVAALEASLLAMGGEA